MFAFIGILSILACLVFIVIVLVRIVNLKIRHEKAWNSKTKKLFISSLVCFVVIFGHY